MAQSVITRPHAETSLSEREAAVPQPRYGLLAEFPEPEPLLEAAQKARDAGYRKMDAYTPMPVEGLSEILNFRDYNVIWTMIAGGLTGGIFAFSFLTWAVVYDYAMNVGGKPPLPWPMFIPITFELTVLGAALSGIFGMFIMNGLPRPHHPLFAVPAFDRASSSGFFLCIESGDPKFDPEATRQFLEGLGASTVSAVDLEVGATADEK